jgi:acyl-CoA synthetase (NDP forming)
MMTARSHADHRLRPLLQPRSIAILGASARQGSFGNVLWNNIRNSRYDGRVFPVNPRYDTLDGERCYPDLASLPMAVDLVTVGVSDDLLETSLEQIIAAKAGAAAMFGRAYEPARDGQPSKIQRLSAVARQNGLPICGANCMGFINYLDDLKISGNPPPHERVAGHIGFVSHSGSTWSGFIGNQRQLLFNYAISAGQEIATTMADYIDFLVEQPETRVVGCIMETVRDPQNFLAALDKAEQRGIPVVVLKLGRSERGRALALAHSGALAGADSGYAAVFERRNVVRVTTPDELADTLELFATSRRRFRRRARAGRGPVGGSRRAPGGIHPADHRGARRGPRSGHGADQSGRFLW